MSKTGASGIVYSCYHQVSRKGEDFVPQHTVSLQLSGRFVLSDGQEQLVAAPGTLNLIRKSQLVKFIKCPPKNGVFESLNIYLDEELLRAFAKEYNLSPDGFMPAKPMVAIEQHPLLQGFMASLQTMIDNNGLDNKALADVKIKELLLILLEQQPSQKNILFDFSPPHKIDIEAFMNRNYRYNVNLERFAYLTGRSLATFKRDFQKKFQISPHQWILKKRLDEAHFLLYEQQMPASEIYIDLGFENLSHFSYSFKKHFGYSPTKKK